MGEEAMDLSRRGIVAGALGAGGLTLAQTTPAAAQAPTPPVTGAIPNFAFNLGGAPLGKNKAGCWSREANVTEFPVSTGLAGVLMSLAPGALRELHWHANAAEWAYVISGHCRITIIDPAFKSETADFGPGDVWYFPRGYGHSIQAAGMQDCVFLLIFDSGYFSEYSTFSISDWIGHTPPDVLAKAFGVPAATFANFPKDEVYFAPGPVPPPLPVDPPAGSQNDGPLTHRYRLLAQKPRDLQGVKLRVVSQKEFPISTTMTGALMDISPGGLRTLHWHPNADEWQYYLSGHARMTVFLSQGHATTVDLGPGYVGYVPRGCGHYIENVGNDDVHAVVAFNSGEYQEISLTEWMASNSPQLLAANFSQPESLFVELAKSAGR
jgi:oxalate decarboxylase